MSTSDKKEIQKALQKKQAVKDLREQVIQHTLETMKSEMAPWAKEYTLIMEDIRIKLTITKQQNTQSIETVEYKGCGTGKTLLCKKIAVFLIQVLHFVTLVMIIFSLVCRLHVYIVYDIMNF